MPEQDKSAKKTRRQSPPRRRYRALRDLYYHHYMGGTYFPAGSEVPPEAVDAMPKRQIEFQLRPEIGALTREA